MFSEVFLLNDSIHLNASFFVFFCTLVSYNFQRLTRIQEIKKIKAVKQQWIVKNIVPLWSITIGAIIISGYYFNEIYSFAFLVWLIPVVIISVLYSWKNLRDFPGVKIFLIALSWAIICGVIPFVILGEQDKFTIVLRSAEVFFFIVAITIPFDIRDLPYDETNKKTIPQLVGVKKSKIIAFCCLVISGLISLSIYKQPMSFIITDVVSLVFLMLSSPKRNDYFFSFGVDGLLVFRFLLLLTL